MKAAFRVIKPGLSAGLQDAGRSGWKKYGVPPSGPMDRVSHELANLALNNPPSAACYECALTGCLLECLSDTWVCITGAASENSSIATWQPVKLMRGDHLEVSPPRRGLWTYIAAEKGFAGTLDFGSCATNLRSHLGQSIHASQELSLAEGDDYRLHPQIANTFINPAARPVLERPQSVRVWPGPQWELFSRDDQNGFFSRQWRVSQQIDRTGYRIEGMPLKGLSEEMTSEPNRVGSIQVPQNGIPIVTMPDGPTVGGYPKIGVVHHDDLHRLAQTRPGETVDFKLETAS